MIFKVKLSDPEEGIESIVEFHDCESKDEPSKVVFTDLSLWFPYDEVPNRKGHIRRNGLCSPVDFCEKAEDFGFEAEIIE